MGDEMKSVSAFCLLLLLFIAGAMPAGAEPSLVYSTPVPGGISDLAVDSAGNAYALVDRGSLGYFVAKLSPLGELIFLRQLELPPTEPLAPPREPLDIAIDPAGNIYVAGYAEYHWECCHDDSFKDAFVTKLGPDGTGLLYDTFFSEGYNTEAHDLTVDALGRAHVRSTSRWPDKYGDPISDGIRFSPAGSIERYFGYSRYLRNYGPTATAVGPSSDLFALGIGWDPDDDEYPYLTLYLQRTDGSSGAVVETLIDDSGTIDPLDVAATPGGGSVVVGEIWEWPISRGFYIAGFGPAGEEVFSRVLNLGAAEILDVAVTSSGQIVLSGAKRTASGSPHAPFILRLDGGTGEVISSMPGGWTVAVGPGGDVYVAMNGGVSRFTENRPPVCSGATASPSAIWPANGKMIPVSILGVTDPEADPATLKVTGITQDEPGAVFSGIGSSIAQVKAERDGKGDGRVYRIQFEATDPTGASCAGQVTVCVPHDQGKRNCVDSAP
jgi:hypothetical protein